MFFDLVRRNSRRSRKENGLFFVSPPAGTEPDSTVSNKPSPVPGTGTSASVSGSKKTAHVTLGKKKCKEKDVEKRKDVPCKS